MRMSRILRPLAVALLGVLCFEGAARHFGWLDPAERPDPYLGLPGTNPLFREERGEDGTAVMRTAPNKTMYRQVEFPAAKAPDEFRVFVVGGSSVRAAKFTDPDGSFAHMLEFYLGAALPRRRVRVINSGGGGTGSVQNLEVLRNVLDLQPDLVVAYPEGGEKNLVPPAPLGLLARADDASVLRVPVRRVLAPLRCYVGARTVYGLLRPDGAAGTASMSVFSAFVTHIVSRPFSETSFTELLDFKRDRVPPLMEHPIPAEEIAHAQARFSANLGSMAALARGRGVPLVFVKPVRNIKTSFYLRFHIDPSEILPGHQDAWRAGYEAGLAAKREGRLDEALATLEAVRAHYVEDTDEILAFYRGECLERLGRWDEARAEYERPLLRHPLRRLLDEAAAAHGVPVVDPYPLLVEAAEHGLPGYDQFIDSFHPAPATARIIALSIAQGLRREGLLPDPAPPDTPRAVATERAVQALVASCRLPTANRMLDAILADDFRQAIALGRRIPPAQLSGVHVVEGIYLGYALTRSGDLDGARALYESLHAALWKPEARLPPLDTDADIVRHAFAGDPFAWF
jgi:hypothetical protein